MNLRFMHTHPMRSLFVFYTSSSCALAVYALYILILGVGCLGFIRPYPACWMFMRYTSSSRVGCLGLIYSVLASSLIFPLTYSVTHLLSGILYYISSYHIFSLAYSVRHLLSDILYHTSSLAYSISHLPVRISHFAFRIFRFAF